MLSIKQFEDNYFQTDGKIIDKQDATLSLLPFNLNPSTSGFDKNCGLSGTTGAFFRKWGRVEVKPIVDYKLDVEDPVTSFLHESGKMQYAQQTEFMKVVEDILYPDGKMSVIDATFLPYLPLVDGYTKGTRAANKYIVTAKLSWLSIYIQCLSRKRCLKNYLENRIFSALQLGRVWREEAFQISITMASIIFFHSSRSYLMKILNGLWGKRIM